MISLCRMEFHYHCLLVLILYFLDLSDFHFNSLTYVAQGKVMFSFLSVCSQEGSLPHYSLGQNKFPSPQESVLQKGLVRKDMSGRRPTPSAQHPPSPKPPLNPNMGRKRDMNQAVCLLLKGFLVGLQFQIS